MKKTTREMGDPEISAGGGRGGSGWTDPTTRSMNQVQQSIKDRGGYPTRGGVPKMTKMQQRQEQMKSDYESTLEQGTSERARQREQRKQRLLGFKKGGMVGGSCRDYGK